MRLRIDHWVRTVPIRAGELYAQARCDCRGDLILQRKHVRHLAVIALAPAVTPVRGADQLGGDPHPRAVAAHAAFEDVADVQPRARFADVEAHPADRERRRSRDDLQTGNPGQRVDDFLRESFTEVVVLHGARHPGEGQHGDRGRCGCRGGGDAGCGAWRQAVEQGASQFGGRLEALGAVLAQAPAKHPLRLRCDPANRGWIVAEDGGKRAGDGAALERPPTGQHL